MIDGFAIDANVALAGRLESQDQAQQGRFAGTQQPEEAEEFIVFDRYANIANGDDITEAFSDVIKLDARHPRSLQTLTARPLGLYRREKECVQSATKSPTRAPKARDEIIPREHFHLLRPGIEMYDDAMTNAFDEEHRHPQRSQIVSLINRDVFRANPDQDVPRASPCARRGPSGRPWQAVRDARQRRDRRRGATPASSYRRPSSKFMPGLPMKRATNTFRGSFIDLQRRAHLLQYTSIHNRDPIGHRHRFELIMGDINHRLLELPLQTLDLSTHDRPEGGVNVAEGLVEQENRRLDNGRTPDGDTLKYVHA